MQFTKVHRKLAKPVYEAIPKIAEKAERECPKCKGQGKFRLSKERIIVAPRYTHIKCPKCNGTGKVKGKWEWKAQPTDWVLFRGEARILMDTPKSTHRDEYIPLLHWEDDIEPILKRMGYDTPFFFHFGPEDNYDQVRCVMYKKDVFISEGHGKDRQESVQQGILALVEGLEEKG